MEEVEDIFKDALGDEPSFSQLSVDGIFDDWFSAVEPSPSQGGGSKSYNNKKHKKTKKFIMQKKFRITKKLLKK